MRLNGRQSLFFDRRRRVSGVSLVAVAAAGAATGAIALAAQSGPEPQPATAGQREFGALRSDDEDRVPPRVQNGLRQTLEEATGDRFDRVRLARDLGDQALYVFEGSRVICVALRKPDAASSLGCSPVADATNPSTPLTTASHDDQRNQTRIVSFVPDRVRSARAVAEDGSEAPATVADNVVDVRISGRAKELRLSTDDGERIVRVDKGLSRPRQ